ncbi:MAG: LamG domain-containing protein [Chloroflexi bacterium]|nr:LamG domain-containing protein [Chloroflexota bacterium]
MARVEPAVQSGGLLKLYQALWAPYYQAVLSVLGSTGVVLPLGDPHHGHPDATSFTTKGDEQVTFTWSEAPSSFDTPLDLTDADSFQGIVPVVTFNGTDEEADTPDAAYWSGGDGTNDNPMSIAFWSKITDTPGARALLSKWGANGNREWTFQVNVSDKLQFYVSDDSAAVTANRTGGAAIPMGRWAHFAMTYDGAGGAAAMDTVTLYVDGAVHASSATNSGSYVAMEDQTEPVMLGAERAGGTPSQFFNGQIAGGPLGPSFAQTELTADEVRALYDLGRAALGL